MRPHLLSSSNLEKLEDLKMEVKSLLIANSKEGVTLDELPRLFESQLGDCIPFKDYNFCSLKEFLSSIPDAVRLCLDKNTNKTYVYPVESDRTKHISSLIARQKTAKRKCSKLQLKSKLHSNYIDPILLTRLMLKLSSCSTTTSTGCFKKADLLSEIQAIIGVYSLYSISDLNVQLNELTHILTHDSDSICLKSEARLSQEDVLDDFIIKQKTKDRLQKLLIEKYPEGIWCEQLPSVYRQEYGIDLEYRDLGFNDIVEFVTVLPANIFKCTQPFNSSKYKVSSATKMPTNNHLTNPIISDSVENFAVDINAGTFRALPTLHSCSKALSSRLIPKEFMNFEDSVEKINVATISDNSDVIVSEICNPSLFWIILGRNKRKLIKLMDNLQEFYVGQEDLDKYKIPPIVLKPGLHVACLYSNRWHRGIIKTATDLNSCMILFYDYGTTKDYKANKLYFLHKKFSYLPAQAIPCCLYNVKPIASCNDKWTQVAIERFVDKTIEKDFLISIHNRNHENNSITVDLIDSSDTVINHWMVSNDLAIFVPETENLMTRQHKISPNVNKISSSEEQDYSTSYVRRAEQLEALRKYNTRFQLLEKQNHESTAGNLNLSVDEKKKDNNYHIDNSIQNSETEKVFAKKQLQITEVLKELEKLMTFIKL